MTLTEIIVDADFCINIGIDDINCVRIVDIIHKFQQGELSGFTRKEAKLLWRLSGKDTAVFDKSIWVLPG